MRATESNSAQLLETLCDRPSNARQSTHDATSPGDALLAAAPHQPPHPLGWRQTPVPGAWLGLWAPRQLKNNREQSINL